MKARAFLILCLSCLLGALPGFAAQIEKAQPERLFVDVEADAALPTDDEAVVRSRVVEINFGALSKLESPNPLKPNKKERVLLNLFPDVELTAVLDPGLTDSPYAFGWLGRVKNEQQSHVALVAGGGVLMGTVQTLTHTYRIRVLDGGLHVVEEIDPTRYPQEAEPIEVPEGYVTEVPGAKLLDDGSRFDLLVVYTPAARAAAGGTAAIQNLIALGVAETNIAYANSKIIPRLNLVHMEEIAYTEAGDIQVDLSRLRSKTDGIMDNVHTLRETYKADLVKLVGDSTAGGCGVGYLMAGSQNRAFESSAFSYTARLCISPNYTFAHELGHNMGSNHAPGDGTGTGAFAYSFGYKNPSNLFRTVMAYDCAGGCPRLLYFSNPSVAYNGATTGTSTQNNANSITNVRSIVANFRQAAAQISCSGTSGQWSGCRGNGCSVCVEKVASYPLYYFNHPSCAINYICGGQYFTCNSACPAPTSADQCNGTAGQWAGCRGDGCSVCEELVEHYPLYFHNHPACQRNHLCGGQYFTCNANCPQPTSADACDGTPGQWAGCRGTGCHVCSELVDEYKCYFKNHPKCIRNTTCDGFFGTCNENCPAPTEADRC